MRLRTPTLLIVVLILAVLIPADSAAAAEVIKDGSFESTPANQTNPNWDEGGVVFEPICDSTCTEGGQGGGTVGPRTGTNWAWFGGTFGPDEQFVAQEVVIPRAPAVLSFYIWVGVGSGNGTDAVRAFMNGQELFEVLEDATGYSAYTQVSLDVSRFVSDRPHDLSFEYSGIGGGVTNISLDDVSLLSGELAPKTVTLSGKKSVRKGKKAKLTARVEPCTGHEGDTIELFRGSKKIKTVASDNACTALFKVKVKKTASYTAISPLQDADHAAGTSNKLKVRVKKPRRQT